MATKRTTHRSSAGKKLYAVRDKKGSFKDIQTYKKAHGADVKRKAKAEPRRGNVDVEVRTKRLASMIHDRNTYLAKAADPLRYAFRNADAIDWDHLFKMLPDSGHGKFWKAVMQEAKAALKAQ